MPIKVEQITKSGLVVSDFDQTLKPSQIKQLLSNQKNLKIESNKNPYVAKYKTNNITLYVKNITYLGRKKDGSGNYDDWEHYKKRIQIGKNFQPISKQKNTLLLGIYCYDDVNVFCLFDKQSYENSSANNASAHIHTMDIIKAKELGVFNKTDNKKNNITIFTEQNFEKVFDMILSNQKVQSLSNELNVFHEFSKTLNVNWQGIDCYTEMMRENFNHAYQSEWAGFYLEYRFNKFLKNTAKYRKYCKYIQHKKDDEIDLDLWFNSIKFYGDLKAHDINHNLLGNDKTMINKAINLHQKVWYVAFSHYTTKDIEIGEVTKFWNNAINERTRKIGKGKIKKLDSYLAKMKNSVKLDNFAVLEINQFNRQYLVDFKQGKNSDGTVRSPKISIKKADIENDNFAIYRQKL